jgi:hypothetical protein
MLYLTCVGRGMTTHREKLPLASGCPPDGAYSYSVPQRRSKPAPP